MKKYYVYHLFNPITGKVFYVGKGKRTRCYQHLRNTLDQTHNKRLWGYINNIRLQGFEPIVYKLQENLDEDYAYELEKLEIEKYGRKCFDVNGILMNIVEGGKDKAPKLYGEANGFYGKEHTQETKIKISIAKKGRINPKTEEAKENSRLAAIEYWTNESEQIQERKEKLGIEGKKYWSGSEEEIEEKKNKLRNLYTKRYMIVWPNGTEEIVVNLKQTCIDKGFNHSSVYKVLSGKRQHHKNCKFYKLDD